ncbi:MAG: hypothetical protein MJZ65_06375 [Paludibacteraceae bacterium]|nr:hypothetical protein [Paludibacteraceae bacterium]
MRRVLYIVGVLLMVVEMNAKTVVVTRDSYQTASLSGDYTETMVGTFYNDTKDGGRVGKDKHATIAVEGMPAGVVQQVTLWIKSNKTSGAATVRLRIHGQQWTMASGSYNKWPGMGKAFSQEYKPLKGLSQVCAVDKGDTVRIDIDGTENSVTVDRMEVTYDIALPVAHKVVLSYCDNQGKWWRDTVMEEAPLSGIVLPAVPQEMERIWVDETPWRWVGWVEEPCESSMSEPLHWEAEDWYGPEEDRILHALYVEDKQVDVVQDTTSASGEYAMVHLWLDSAYAMAGIWQNSRIAMEPVQVAIERDGLWHWHTTYASKVIRYALQRTEDSVTVQHVESQTGIGYSLSGVANKKVPWAWKRGAQGSVFPHSTWTHFENAAAHLDYWQGYSWAINEATDGSKEVRYGQEMWQEENPYWLLFPTGALPTSYTPGWSTLPYFTALKTTRERPTIRKEMRNGHIQIRSLNRCYTLLGESL